jgi:alkylation response protein AidB-like acyl-CoA dehydrogenase
MDTSALIKGGSFLIGETQAHSIFTPEDFTEEHLMIAKTCRDFLVKEVYPHLDLIDSHKDPAFMPGLLDKAGELGLLGTSVPEEYGGFGMNFVTSMLVAEVIGAGHSFAVALSAHTGIGTLPILYYGNEAQKQKYLPKLASGEYKSAYCLTEPDSGSDANSGKTKAILTADGKHYLLNGQKMWITNGGFADVFTVFAKIDDDKNLSAFIVERSYPGITMNEEEEKMGIKGSSTRQVFFNDCLVPVENLLSERGNGFKIAVNILNIGRIKLAGAAVGACKKISELSIQYANERKQFGVSIGSFGAIQHKIAEQAVKIFASEAAVYRASQNIEDTINAYTNGGMDSTLAKLKGVEQFAIECAIMKVHGSEVLDYVADEGVQIYGGMGYSADAPMDRAYRDARINRIFEGTNEINRLLAVGTLIKRAMKGELDLIGPALAVQKEIMGIPEFGLSDESFLAEEKKIISNLKKALLMVSGAAVQKFGFEFEQQQEIIMQLADMLIEIYVAESVVLRVEKMQAKELSYNKDIANMLMQVYVQEAADKCNAAGKTAIVAFASGDEQKMMLLGLKRFTKTNPKDLIGLRRKIAAYMLEKNTYPFVA